MTLRSEDLPLIREVAVALASTDLLGRARSRDELVGLGLIGAELGVPPATAMRSLYVTKDGAPVVSADLLLSLLARAGVEVTFRELRPLCVVVEMRRPGHVGHWIRFSAQTTEHWPTFSSNYPFGWIRSRAVAALARLVAPDVATRLVTVEEEMNDRYFDIEAGPLDGSGVAPARAAPSPPKAEPEKREVATVAELRVLLRGRVPRALQESLLRTADAFFEMTRGADAATRPGAGDEVAEAKRRTEERLAGMRAADGAPKAGGGRELPEEPPAADRADCDRLAARFRAPAVAFPEQLSEVAKEEAATIEALSDPGRKWVGRVFNETMARLRRAENARRSASKKGEVR